MTDKGLFKARALVVDGNSLSRALLASQLRDLGLAQVDQSPRVGDARPLVERNRYDIVLCDYHFDGSEISGQDFLDELRRERLLPWSTVFIMVTGEATYARVAEAAESALDGYLIKPYRPTVLSERILQARRRKQELGPLLAALDRQDWAHALELASQRLAQRAPYWPYAARLAAELHLQEGQAADAQRLFETVRTLLDDPAWARLGVARALLAGGHANQARQVLVALRRSEPGFADACDVLGRIELEAGELDGALTTFRAATAITPGCLVRLQQAGSVAFMCGQPGEALELLERTVSFGVRSKLFDAWTLLLIALLRFDAGEQRPLAAATERLARMAARHQNPERLRRQWICAKALQRLLAGDTTTAWALAQDMIGDPLSPTLETATAFACLALLSRFPADKLPEDDAARLAEPLARRFGISRAAVITLTAYARRRPGLVDIVHRGQRETTRMAEEAMEHALHGDPVKGVECLVRGAEQTANRRLVDMAAMLWRRHEHKLAEHASRLADRINDLQYRYNHAAPVLAGELRSARTPGGMVLGTAQTITPARTVRPGSVSVPSLPSASAIESD